MAKDFADINRLEHEAGIQAPEAGSKDELVNKFVKAWENQTARRVAKGGTGLTMALTLAACGSSSSTPVVSTSGETEEVEIPSEAFTLTAGVDEFTGDDGDDVFTAPLVNDPANITVNVQSLGLADILDGGAGNDVLNATLNANAGAPSISNIEEVYLRSVDNAAAVDFSNVVGAEQLWNDRSIGNLDVTAVLNAVTIGLSDVRGLTTYSVTYANDALDSDEYTQALVLNGAGTADDTVTLVLAVGGDDAITGLDITASGVNNVTNTLAGIETVTIAGSGELTLDLDYAALTTLAAAGYSGDLTLDLSAATLESVVTGAGDDDITIDGTLLEADAEGTLNLGAGDNTLRLDGITTDALIADLAFTGDDLTVAGVTTLSFVDAITLGANATLDLDGVSPSEIAFEDAVDVDADTLTLDNTAASLTLTFDGVLDAVAGGMLDFGDAAETVAITAEDAIGGPNAITFAGEALETFTLNAEAGATFDIGADMDALDSVVVDATGNGSVITAGINGNDAAAAADEASLTSLSLSDSSDDGDVQFTVTLTDTYDLGTINATVGEDNAVAGIADFVVDASVAAFDGAVTINVEFLVDADGDTAGEFLYSTDAANAVRETFVFTGDNLGTVTIDDGAGGLGFTIGAGANADRIDLSAFGITDVNDLVIVDGDGTNGGATGDAVISAANDEFDGVIVLVDVTHTDLSATNFLA